MRANILFAKFSFYLKPVALALVLFLTSVASADTDADVREFLAQYPDATRASRVQEFRAIVAQKPPQLYDTILAAIRHETSREFGYEIGLALGNVNELTAAQLKLVSAFLAQGQFEPAALGGLAHGLGKYAAKANATTRAEVLKVFKQVFGRELISMSEGAARGMLAMNIEQFDVFHDVVEMLSLQNESLASAQTILLREIREKAPEKLTILESLLRRRKKLSPELAIEIIHCLQIVKPEWTPRMNEMYQDAVTSPFASPPTLAHAALIKGACGPQVAAGASSGLR